MTFWRYSPIIILTTPHGGIPDISAASSMMDSLVVVGPRLVGTVDVGGKVGGIVVDVVVVVVVVVVVDLWASFSATTKLVATLQHPPKGLHYPHFSPECMGPLVMGFAVPEFPPHALRECEAPFF